MSSGTDNGSNSKLANMSPSVRRVFDALANKKLEPAVHNGYGNAVVSRINVRPTDLVLAAWTTQLSLEDMKAHATRWNVASRHDDPTNAIEARFRGGHLWFLVYREEFTGMGEECY